VRSSQGAAYRLLRDIARIERRSRGDTAADRRWILETYAACARLVETAGDGRRPEPAPDPALGQWLLNYCAGGDCRADAMRLRAASLRAPPEAVAALCGVIAHLRPAVALAVGLSCGRTAREIAEVLARRGGRLIALDPEPGGDLPGIVACWPVRLRAATVCHATSMPAALAEAAAAQGVSAFGVALIAGQHDAAPALLAVASAADSLAPGGIVLVEDLQLPGPRHAVLEMMRNPGWKLFYRGGLWRGPLSPQDLRVPPDSPAEWGILIAPLQRGVDSPTR